jgi:dolichol-phosphate mannosyltransferase
MPGITLSVVIPVYNEGNGICLLVQRLTACLAGLDVPWEVILVDDHSVDDTPDVLRRVCSETPVVHSLRLSRNSGSHIAILAGLEHSRGDCGLFMAADLQDPPELIPQLLALWREGYDTVWAVRAGREGVSLPERAFSRLFYWLLTRFSESSLPPDGSDFALVSRRVIDALIRSAGANLNLFGEVANLGFRQAEVRYVKGARAFGKTKWNLRKKLKLLADTFVSFSYTPLRLMSYLGIASSFLGFLYALLIVIRALLSLTPVQGWASLMVIVLVMSGLQMIMLGVLGEYLWRTLDESRRRPRYFIEDSSESLSSERADNAERS